MPSAPELAVCARCPAVIDPGSRYALAAVRSRWFEERARAAARFARGATSCGYRRQGLSW